MICRIQSLRALAAWLVLSAILWNAEELSAAPGTLIQTYNNPAPGPANQFGYAVAALGSDIVVGAFQNDAGPMTNAGAVYVFNGATGALRLTINNPTPDFDDNFGFAIATLGTNIIIGANNDGTGGLSVGSAYLFDGTLSGVTSTPLLTINNPNAADIALFGWSVAAHGSNIVVGAYGDPGGGFGGAVYVFSGAIAGTTSTPLLTIVNPTAIEDQDFGWSLAALGSNTLIVGAPREDTGATHTGSVYLFNGTLTGTISTPILTIHNPTPEVDDAFGASVAAIGTKIAVGATFDSDIPSDIQTGSVYLFDGALTGVTSTPLLTINSPAPSFFERFGVSLASLGANLLVGADLDDTVATDAGSVYIFDGTATGITSTPMLPIIHHPTLNSQFGVSVAAVGNNILVGAYKSDTGATDAGSAYLFCGLVGVCPTPSPTPTPAPTLTPTPVPTLTPTPVPTLTPTPGPTLTPTPAPTLTPTPAPTLTPTPAPSLTPTPSPTPTPTVTPSPTPAPNSARDWDRYE